MADAITPYSDELKAADFDPTNRLTQLAGAGGLIEGAHKLRLQAETAAANAVQHEQDVRNQFYTLAATTVDLVEGALGKSHELSVKLRGLRASLTGNHNAGSTPAPTPAPTKSA